MKKRNALILSCLLVLYIAPMIFAPSSYHATIPTEQNTSKEFSLSDVSWYNPNWDHRREIFINGSAGAGTNYPVLVEFEKIDSMQTDLDDIRFTDNDGVTLLDYWIEKFPTWDPWDLTCIIWVNVTDSLETDTSIYMYYENDGASGVSNGTDTFLVFEDWASESIRDDVWDITASDGSVSYSAVDATHGKVAKFDANAGATYRIKSDDNTTSPTAVMFRSNIEEATSGNTARQGSGWDGAFAFALVQTTATAEVFFVYDDDGNSDNQIMNIAYFDTWVTFQITRDGTNTKLYADTVLIETASCEPDILTTNPATSIMLTDSEDDLYSDWVAVRKFIADEPVLDSFGDEDSYTYYWVYVGEVPINFSVPFDETGLRWWLIIMGMCMVPASTLYLVKGGKDEMNSDKAFYAIVVFILGWALILGFL